MTALQTLRIVVKYALALIGIAAVLAAMAGIALAQARSGPRSVNACQVVTAPELEAAFGKPVMAMPVPAGTPASLGVSVCMYATKDGRRNLSVTTYGPEAVRRTHSQTVRNYYEAMKTSTASLAGRPAQVVPGAGRHASYFPNPRGNGEVIYVLRNDCTVTINAQGFTKEEIVAVAKAAGN